MVIGYFDLLFGEIFEVQISNEFCLKMTEIGVKRPYIVWTFLFWGDFDSLKLVEKSSETMGNRVTF